MLTELDQQRVEISRGLDPERRSSLGQFMTPAPVAEFMAELFDAVPDGKIRLLDPGAGLGSLTVAFWERFLPQLKGKAEVESVAYELDDHLAGHLALSLQGLSKAFRKHGLAPQLLRKDFIRDSAAKWRSPEFTHAILNPPYKKIHSGSDHRKLLRTMGIESVNLYSAFVEIAVDRMVSGGQLVAIIPRSFCNGPYYKAFRGKLVSRTTIRHIHVFNARNQAFKDDEVLQENVILLLEKGGRQGRITVSRSTDSTFSDYQELKVDASAIVDSESRDLFIRIPTSAIKSDLIRSKKIAHTLEDLGIQVSTGPVVDFRVKGYLRDAPAKDTVPLLYPGHFNGHQVNWPKRDFKKSDALVLNDETRSMLFPKGYYTVVRRFSSKEERRRIFPAVVHPSLGKAGIGFENHLNVFHRHKKGISEAIAWGLAAYLSSSQVDACFREFNGHTQVNATDLRSLKYPDLNTLEKLGRWAVKQGSLDQHQVDERIASVL